MSDSSALQMEMLAVALEVERCRQQSSTEARQLIAGGWRAAYAEIFGQSFIDSLDSAETGDRHHSEAIKWHWEARLGLIHFELEINQLRKQVSSRLLSQENFEKLKNDLQNKWYPVFWAYLAIWARGNLKTTVVRRVAVMDAVMSNAYGVGGYALIVGGTKKKVRGTATSIDSLLQTEKVKQYAPNLAKVKRGEQGGAKGWTADFINTEANYIFHFIGLDEGVAGANVDDIRPTFIVPDDIDDREDSPVIAENRFNVLTRSIIPTKQWNTLFFFAQNLISRFAVLYRIYKQQDRVLANRYATEPIPAVRNLVTEQRTINRVVRDVVVAGECTWRGWNLREVQNQIDAMTLPVFQMECQHEVGESKQGLVHKNYDDKVHPVSYSQFASRYGSPDAWKNWYKVPFSDWSRTKTKYHANVAGYLMVSSQNTALPGLTFCLPLSFKAAVTPEDVAVRLLSVLTPFAYQNKTWNDLLDEAWKRTNAEQHFSNVTDRLDYLRGYYKAIIPNYSRRVLREYHVKTGANSHSEDKVREMLNEGFGFNFVPSNPPSNSGAIEKIETVMRVDYNESHLFDSRKKGYTRWYVLCPDDLSATPEIINSRPVYPPVPFPDVMSPDDLHDSDLFRYQMGNRRFADQKLTELGERGDILLKLNDDFGQGLEMVYFLDLLSNIELTFKEVVEAQMPEHLSRENIAQYYGQPGFPELVVAKMAEENRVKQEIEGERRQQEENLRNTFGGRRIKLFGQRRRR